MNFWFEGPTGVITEYSLEKGPLGKSVYIFSNAPPATSIVDPSLASNRTNVSVPAAELLNPYTANPGGFFLFWNRRVPGASSSASYGTESGKFISGKVFESATMLFAKPSKAPRTSYVIPRRGGHMNVVPSAKDPSLNVNPL